MSTPTQIWTSLVKLTDHKLPLAEITTNPTTLPHGSPVLHKMSLGPLANYGTSTQSSSLDFLQAFMLDLTTKWTSQDSLLLSYDSTVAESNSLYTMKYHTVLTCTRFSTFVEHEVDKVSDLSVLSQASVYNVIPENLTTAFLKALRNALISAATTGPPATAETATPAGLLFWTQFASANPGDKVTLVIDDIFVETNSEMKPKCAADIGTLDEEYSGYFGVEIRCT